MRNRAFKTARISTGNADLGRVSARDITIDFILDEPARELIGEENRRMTLLLTGGLFIAESPRIFIPLSNTIRPNE